MLIINNLGGIFLKNEKRTFVLAEELENLRDKLNKDVSKKHKVYKQGMKEFKISGIFPRDKDTLLVISEMEAYLRLDSKDINKMSDAELIEYIDQIVLILLKH